jgi:glycosyltransferase involved in cell wall biosynthesis
MHILEIPSFFPPYGGLFCLEQAKALKVLGHEVRILSNVQLGVTIGLRDYVVRPYHRFAYEMEGVTVCQSYQRGLPHMVHHNMERWVGIVRSMFRDYVKQYGNPDVLHAHCAKWAGYAAMLIGEEYGIPYVITEHLSQLVFEKEFGPAPSHVWQIAYLKEAYERAAMVIPVSEELVDSLSCYFGRNYRWKSISNMVDTEYFHYQQRTSRDGRMFRFCCLANFWPLKGYDILIAAFRKLKESGQPVELHIAGKGTDSAACRAMLSEGIFTHGLLSKKEVRDLLYCSDALVLASRSEVQPLVLLEAMSTGIPVVSTECIPRSLRIEEGCTIVPIDDAEALASAMRHVVEQPVIDGKLLSKKISALASPAVVGRQLEQVFIEVLASR